MIAHGPPHGSAAAEAWNLSKTISFQLLPVLGAGYGFIVAVLEETNKPKKDAEPRHDSKQRHEQHQQWYRDQLARLNEESIGLFELLPRYLRAAEKCLDQAEIDFADGAFAPFWDSIEKAALWLGRFDEGVQQIKNNLCRYTEVIGTYEDVPPRFPISRQSVAKLGVGTTTAERMKPIVRAAQRDFRFATIYEQRKTNQILVAGFRNLAEALEIMTSQIATSIGNLTDSVDVMTLRQDESMRAIQSRLGDVVDQASQHHDKLMAEASEGAARERKALEMLDNIQRRRRPSL
jgi:hypothetical protein